MDRRATELCLAVGFVTPFHVYVCVYVWCVLQGTTTVHLPLASRAVLHVGCPAHPASIHSVVPLLLPVVRVHEVLQRPVPPECLGLQLL